MALKSRWCCSGPQLQPTMAALSDVSSVVIVDASAVEAQTLPATSTSIPVLGYPRVVGMPVAVDSLVDHLPENCCVQGELALSDDSVTSRQNETVFCVSSVRRTSFLPCKTCPDREPRFSRFGFRFMTVLLLLLQSYLGLHLPFRRVHSLWGCFSVRIRDWSSCRLSWRKQRFCKGDT